MCIYLILLDKKKGIQQDRRHSDQKEKPKVTPTYSFSLILDSLFAKNMKDLFLSKKDINSTT